MRFIIGLGLFSFSIHTLVYAVKADNDVGKILASAFLGVWYSVAFLKQPSVGKREMRVEKGSKLMKYILALVMFFTATLCYADGEYTTDGYFKSDIDLNIQQVSSLRFEGKKYRWEIDEKVMMDMTPKEIDDMTVAIRLFTSGAFYTGEFIDAFCTKYLPNRCRTKNK